MATEPLPRALRPRAASAYQRAVLDFVANERGHGLVEATAGSGKTSTLVMVAELLVGKVPVADQGGGQVGDRVGNKICDQLGDTSARSGAGRLGQQGRACFLAFNRATAAELRARLPESVAATTIHALGRQVLVAALPKAATGAPQEDKYERLARQRLPREGAAYLAQLATFVRLEVADPHDLPSLSELARRYRLEPPVVEAELDALHAELPGLLEAGAAAARAGEIDYSDMVYLCLKLGLPVPRLAFVCVDEAQDLSRMALELILRLVEAGARALFVGDPRQAINAFAGADSRSLARVRERTGATVLPLSVSYRCPSRHVILARRFAPEMENAPGASRGGVRVLPAHGLVRALGPGDLVMSRTNAPLVGLALDLAQRGKRSVLLGGSLAREAMDLARRLFPDGELRRAGDQLRESAKAEAALLEHELLTSLQLPGALEQSAERHRGLLIAVAALLRRHANPGLGELEEVLAVTFGGGGDPPGGELDPRHGAATTVLPRLAVNEPVVLSTIHRAKGREAQRVFLLGADELAAGARSEEDAQSEANVLFVALTRSQDELVLVESKPGALAARLALRGRAPSWTQLRASLRAPTPGERLSARWEDVLGLALIMHRSGRANRPRTGVLSQRGPLAKRLIIRG